jgi:hypothetical protein
LLLNAEIKDDGYTDLPRQQQAQYAYPATTYLKSDAASGRHYVDLNEAAKSYSGAWLFGKQQIDILVGNLKAQWQQWCPVPAGIADGVLLKGNVIYQNHNGTYRVSDDVYEGEVHTEGGVRYFQGRTTHTFYGQNYPNGSIRVQAQLNIPLTERLAYNPMVVTPRKQIAYTRDGAENQPGGYRHQQYYRKYQQPYNENAATYQNAETESYQQPDAGF